MTGHTAAGGAADSSRGRPPRPGGAVADAFGKGRPALVGYLPAGFPDVAQAKSGIRAMIDAGVDLVEIGLPYSDPVMDGPVIQRAAEAALAAGVRTRDVFDTVAAVGGLGVPILVMTYWNPVEKYGVAAFARDLANAGGAGLITPDLIPDEADEWLAASDEHKLDRVFLVSPSSTDERIAMTAAHCRGFVYATAVMGVTGAREQTSEAAPRLVARVRQRTCLPVGVGLGVRDGNQVRSIAAYADAVIVGSALVAAMAESGVDGVRTLVTELKSGLT